MSKSRKLVKLIADRDREIFDLVNYVFIISVVSLFGVVTNVMNMTVFLKQGFINTMNISFFGMAISDLGALLTMLWCGVCLNPLLVKSDVLMETTEIQYLTGGSPHAIFVRVTGWITVFVTAERCLCIVYPLKIKQLITPKRTTLAVCVIYLVNIASFIPEYSTCYFDWKFYPVRNRTLLGIVFTKGRTKVEGLMFVLYSIMGSASFAAIIVFTAVLVVQLKIKSQWRVKANIGKESYETISARDRKTMNMVVMIATTMIVCYTPGVVASLVTFFGPDITVAGVNLNVFFVLWSYVFIFDVFNSSVNIFLYYKLSSKYRKTFKQIFLASRQSKTR